MTIGGGYLATLGGSWYYLVAGVGLLVVAGLLFARRRAAIWLYATLLLGTLAWTFYECASTGGSWHRGSTSGASSGSG